MLGAWQMADAQDTLVSSPAVILSGEAGVSDSCWGLGGWLPVLGK